MKTMKKIVALMAVALLLCSILPLSVFAADETITVTGATGALASDSLSISWDGTNYQVVNYRDNSTTAIRTSDSAHFRVYVGNEFYVQGKDGALMAQVVINCVSSYLINNASNTVSDGWTVSANGNAITYTATSGAESELHISIGKQSRVTSVVITPGFASGADCDHASLSCGETCSACGEYTKEHKYGNNCVAECENGCGTANPDYADHVYDGTYDANCNVCGEAREVNYPAADSELTITEANELGQAMSHDTTTPNKYYVTGVVESIANTTYGNLYIQDDAGNKLYVYGTYDADGSNRFDAMTEKPAAGMTITVYGVIGNYNGAQMKNGWITAMEGGCEHEYLYECTKTCSLCGLETRPEAECVNEGYACQDGLCVYCGNDMAGLGHAYDDQWDADCNYGCGETREVEEKPNFATITFDDTSKRTEQTNDIQVWVENGIIVTNNKANSTSNIIDSSNPVRFYKSSEVTVAYAGMTSIEFYCNTAAYATALANSIGDGAVVNDKLVTVSFDAPVDTYTVALTSGQVRMDSIIVYGSSSGSEECAHEWNAATCTAPATCALCGATDGAALGHNYESTVLQAPSCTNVGLNSYSCTVCGDYYEEQIAAAGHNYVDGNCAVCGAKQVSYAPITSADQLVSGEYILVVDTGYAPTYLDGTWVLTGQPTIADGIITEGAGFLWTLTVDGTSVIITDANGVSIAPKGGNNNGIQEGEYAWSWTFEDGKFIFAGTGDDTVYLASNATAGSGDNKFRAYKTTTVTGSSYSYQFTLYAAIPEEEPEIIYGDANGDGLVDIVDEALLAQYNAGWDVTMDEVAADANGDGLVDIVDEALLAQYNAGWDVVLGPADDDENKLFNDGELTVW